MTEGLMKDVLELKFKFVWLMSILPLYIFLKIFLIKQWFKYLLRIGCLSSLFLFSFSFYIFRYFKWLHLTTVYNVLSNLYHTPSKDHSSDSSLALDTMMIWILNSAYYTLRYHHLHLAKQACLHILTEDDADPKNLDAVTAPLIYEAGTYFICDVVRDSRTHVYHILYFETFDPQLILQIYEKGMMNELEHILRVRKLQTGPQ